MIARLMSASVATRGAVLMIWLACAPLQAAEPELFRSDGALPTEALSAASCVYFRNLGLEWANGLPAQHADATAEVSPIEGILAFGNVQALRFGGSPLRMLSAALGSAPQLTIERVGPDRVLVDLRIEVDHGCVLELKRYPLMRVKDSGPRIAQLRLVEQMTQAIVDAQRAREDINHAGSARAWTRALELRSELGMPRDAVTLQIDQQRIQSWAIASLPVPAEDAQRLVDEATATLGANHAVTANAYTALGWTLRRHGRHKEAVAAFRRAHELTAASQGPTYRATLRLQQALADQLVFAGQRSEALALMEAAYRHRVELLGTEHEETWRALVQLVDLYTELGRGDEAEPLARQGYERNRAVLGETHRMTLYSLAVVVRALRAARRYEEALPMQEREVAQRVEVYGASDPTTATALVDLADTQLRLHRVEAASATMQRAIEGMNAERRGAGGAGLMLLQARTPAAAGDVAAAREEYARLLPSFEQRFGPANRFALDARFEGASLASEAGDYVAAQALYEEGIAILERLRAEGGMSVESRQALLASYADAYRRAAWVAFRLRRDEDALRLTELSKARTLLDTLIQRRAEASAGLAREDQVRFADLAERINATQAQVLAAQDDPIRRAALEVQRSDLVRELAALQADLRERSPAYAQLSAVRLVERGDQIRTVLPGDVVFVSYVIVPADEWRPGSSSKLLALVMRRSKPLAIVDLGSADGLPDLVQRFRAALGVDLGAASTAARAKPAAAAAAGEIAARWLAPLRPLLQGYRRLVIAPDGALTTLPFEALPWKDRLLIEAFDVTYSQSLSVYALVRERAATRRDSPRALFAIGAPQFDSLSGSAESAVRGLPATGSVRRAKDRLSANWAPLPGAMSELQSVAGIFGAARSEVVAGRDATEDTLDARNRSGELRRYRYLLFATHGLLDPEEPGLSALILGRAAPDSAHDGYVTALEWLDYRVQSDLIVLSACSSGQGRLLKGEGVLGLPYAMFVAGNRDALLTLWAVADASTREFITQFFEQVRAGRTHADALAIVKRRFARDARYRAPAFWAGFVLYGS